MSLIPLSDHNIYVPPDWECTGTVLCIPGSTVSGFEGWGKLSLTPEALVLATPQGVEAAVPLWSIEDVQVVKFDGVLIERPTSVGPLLTPLPYPHGIEVVASIEIRLRLRLRLVLLAANAAHTWATRIRQRAQQAQLGIMKEMMPKTRPPESK